MGYPSSMNNTMSHPFSTQHAGQYSYSPISLLKRTSSCLVLLILADEEGELVMGVGGRKWGSDGASETPFALIADGELVIQEVEDHPKLLVAHAANAPLSSCERPPLLCRHGLLF